VIRKHLFGLARGKAQEAPWTMRPQAGSSATDFR
jgi:hypothetical protein